MKRIISYFQGIAVFAILFTVKGVQPVVHYYQYGALQFKSGHAMRVAKFIQKDLPIVLQ